MLRHIIPVLYVLVWCSNARAQDYDMVKTASGLSPGTIKSISALEIVITQSAGDKTIPVNDVEWVRFKGEPRELNQVRVDVGRGAFDDVIAGLEKVKLVGTERAEIKQDVDFYQAFAKGRLALAGKGDVAEAGKLVFSFVSRPENRRSYHFYQANELLGDLLAANGNFDQAARYYSEVAKTDWPDYKMRANLALGRALLAQKKYDEAKQKFSEVSAVESSGKPATISKLLAKVGQAECLTEMGQGDQAVSMIEQVIAEAPADAQEVYARAYVTLGNSYRKLSQPKQALLAFLHVPVLFGAYPESHAESLANLRTLWNEVNQPDRAKEAEQTLLERYPNSRWAKQ